MKHKCEVKTILGRCNTPAIRYYLKRVPIGSTVTEGRLPPGYLWPSFYMCKDHQKQYQEHLKW